MVHLWHCLGRETGDRKSESDGMMVGYSQVQALQIVGWCARGADETQLVTFSVGGALYMLREVKAVQQQQELCGERAAAGVNMYVEAPEQECGWCCRADSGK